MKRPRNIWLSAAGLAFAALCSTACESSDSTPQDNANCNQPELTCTSCHGDPATDNPAPPADTDGNEDTTAAGVGAHRSHLGTSDWHAALACTDCHVVPTAVNAPGHIDGTAALTWGALATADGATPLYDRAAATCAGVYCHGGTLGEGGAVVQWTVVGGGEADCGTCHGLPPAAPHPQNADCESCHGMVVDASLHFVDPARHIDGTVDVEVTACNACHGSATNDAPPVDTAGLSDTSEVTVGAHQAHLSAASWHRPVECADCHVVPANVNDPGHMDASPAELTWSAVASADGATPSFDRVATTCSDVYCHGATLLGPNTGGTVARTPEWTTVDGTWDSCGDSCHTNPPGGSHPANDQCQMCHSATISSFDPVTPASSVWNDPGLHVNGTVNF